MREGGRKGGREERKEGGGSGEIKRIGSREEYE